MQCTESRGREKCAHLRVLEQLLDLHDVAVRLPGFVEPVAVLLRVHLHEIAEPHRAHILDLDGLKVGTSYHVAVSLCWFWQPLNPALGPPGLRILLCAQAGVWLRQRQRHAAHATASSEQQEHETFWMNDLVIHVAPLLTVVSSLSSLRFFVAGATVGCAGRFGLRRPGADDAILLSHSTLESVGKGHLRGELATW